ncbi:Cytochrome P450 83B1 [Linum perenne]
MAAAAFVLLLLLSLPLLLLLFINHRRRSNLRLPPGPKPLPIIGHLHMLDNTQPQRQMYELAQKYGPLVSLRLGFWQALVVSSAKMAKEVMKYHDLEFCSRPNLLGQRKLSYEGLDVVFAPYNDYWREMRKICVLHLFNSRRVQTFRPIREEEVSRMITKVKSCAESGKSLDISEMMMSLTISIICLVSLGKKYDDDAKERQHLISMLMESQAMFGNFFYGDYFPGMRWLDKLNGMVNRLDKNFKDLDTFYQEVIDQHLDPNRPKPEREDIIDVLLRIKEEKDFSIDLTWDHIKGVLMNVFIAGTETSAATVIWAMSFLITNPRCLKKAQAEVRAHVGDKGFVDEDDIQELPYLKAIVKETFRLQPAVPMLAIGRDPEAWDRPHDFYPERFVGSDIDFKGVDFELVPFGAGRRGCPGIHMGVATVDIALANLLYGFDWEMPAGMKKEEVDFDVLPGITMHKKNHLWIVPKLPVA